MRRMDGLSAFLLGREKTDAYMHTLKISILDVNKSATPWTYDGFLLSVAKKMHLIPMFRWKFKKVPFGLHHPVWVDDPDFDLGYHVRHVACPAPGDRKAFCQLVSDIYAWKLDMSKPLWTCWVVEGVEDGKVALITLLHHAYTDGTGAARLLHKFFSSEPQTAKDLALESVVPWQPEPTPNKLIRLKDALIDLPKTWMVSLPKVSKGIIAHRKMKRKFLKSGGELPPSAIRDSRDSPFNVMLGHARTFVYEPLDLAEIKATSKAFNVTINDLFVAAAAGAYRKFMFSRGFNPNTGPLVTAIPVSKRPPIEEDDLVGNLTSADYLAMPVHLDEPLARLKAARAAGMIMKEHIKNAEGVDLSSLLELTPPLVLRALDWFVKKKEGRFGGIWGNAALSNVPGPKDCLYMGDIPLDNWISMGQIFHGLGLNTTVWSYNGKFNLCILADSKLLPNGWELINLYLEAFNEFHQLAKEKSAEKPQVHTVS